MQVESPVTCRCYVGKRINIKYFLDDMSLQGYICIMVRCGVSHMSSVCDKVKLVNVIDEWGEVP